MAKKKFSYSTMPNHNKEYKQKKKEREKKIQPSLTAIDLYIDGQKKE
jgi:hypothetical protein